MTNFSSVCVEGRRWWSGLCAFAADTSSRIPGPAGGFQGGQSGASTGFVTSGPSTVLLESGDLAGKSVVGIAKTAWP